MEDPTSGITSTEEVIAIEEESNEKFPMTATKTADFEEITKAGDNREYERCHQLLSEMLQNCDGLHPDSIATAFYSRAVIDLTTDPEKNKDANLAQALKDLHEVARMINDLEEAAPNDNFNLKGMRFSNAVYMKPNQTASQVLEWVRTLG